jgi:hypothetical protein
VTPEKLKQAFLYRNPVSYFGGLVVAGSVALILVTVILMTALGGGSPYFGIFAFLVLPMFVVLGLLIFFFGAHRESLRRRRLGTTVAPAYPRVDLNDPAQRRRFGLATVGAFLLLILLAVVSYHGFLFTESVTFCGKLCHTVMEPEFAAYQHSPHAKVRCVDCHVGSGASFYVKSKLSGVRQVFAVTFQTYEKPIATPVKNLRPARETCEECHWPQKFYGAQLLQIPYFRYDETNTSDQINLMMKTGGGSSRLGQSAGIHWHMIIDNSITFAARDEQQQDIAWFKVVGAFGQEREYTSLDKPISREELAKLPKHTMDCMDCHNRPTHVFTPPDRAVDLALNNGSIKKDLPWIKKVATEALMAPYSDSETARREIRDRIFNFYATSYPDTYASRATDLQEAVTIATGIYSRTVFPKMNVDWRTYSDNIGHRNWSGCFRCHDGRHATADGKVLTRECTACHTMPQRGPVEALGALPPISEESWHPLPLKSKHAVMMCNRCHSPGVRPTSDCATCHKLDAKAPMMASGCDTCHAAEQAVQPINDCASCHDSLGELHKAGGHPDVACTECHKPHGWKVAGRDTCLTCHDDKAEHYNEEKAACATCHEFAAAS